MKLLFDQNLSPKLVNRLADLSPGSSHVQAVGLDCASDDQVWDHARLNGFAIVTKDEDYNNLSVVRGSPPKVIWLHLGGGWPFPRGAWYDEVVMRFPCSRAWKSSGRSGAILDPGYRAQPGYSNRRRFT